MGKGSAAVAAAVVVLVLAEAATVKAAIRTDRLSGRELRAWRAIVEVVRAAAHDGRPLYPALHRLFRELETSVHVIQIEMSRSSASSGTAGRFLIETLGTNGGHEGSIRLNLRTIDHALRGPQDEAVFARLGKHERRAQVLGHELAHAAWAFAEPDRARLVHEVQERRQDLARRAQLARRAHIVHSLLPRRSSTRERRAPMVLRAGPPAACRARGLAAGATPIQRHHRGRHEKVLRALDFWHEVDSVGVGTSACRSWCPIVCLWEFEANLKPTRQATADAPERVESQVRILVAEEWNQYDREKAIEALGALGPEAAEAAPYILQAVAHVYALDDFVNDRDIPGIPSAARTALAKIGPAALTYLVEGLGKGDDLVRWVAAESLGDIGPPAKDAIPALIEAVKRDGSMNADPKSALEVPSAAVWALARIGSAAVPALVQLIQSGGELSHRLSAASALREMGPARAGRPSPP